MRQNIDKPRAASAAAWFPRGLKLTQLEDQEYFNSPMPKPKPYSDPGSDSGTDSASVSHSGTDSAGSDCESDEVLCIQYAPIPTIRCAPIPSLGVAHVVPFPPQTRSIARTHGTARTH